jgi:hypothetical protein
MRAVGGQGPEGIPRIETSAFSLKSFGGPRIPTFAADRPHRIFTLAVVPISSEADEEARRAYREREDW